MVDPGRGVRESLRMVLQAEYDVVLAAGYFEGLVAVHETKPDLVFWSVEMPEASGFEILRLLAEIAPGTQVVLTTMTASPVIQRNALQGGALDCLVKPFGATEVLAAVEKGMSQAEPKCGE